MSHRSKARTLCLYLVCTMLELSCRNTPVLVEPTSSRGYSSSTDTPSRCLAIRGNGHYILSHFGGLARMTELYGPMDALAGGSSASITMMLYESMRLNPRFASIRHWSQRDHAASTELALLLKSVYGLADAWRESAEGQSMLLLADLAQGGDAGEFFNVVANEGVDDILRKVRGMRSFIERAGRAQLIDPEVLSVLQAPQPLDQQWLRRFVDIRESFSTLLAFKAESPEIFFRRGVLSFDRLARVWGRLGDFYAGREPASQATLAHWLDVCAPLSRGLAWADIAGADVPGGTCKELLTQAFGQYRDALDRGFVVTDPTVKRVAGLGPLRIVASTALYPNGADAARFRAQWTAYQARAAGSPPPLVDIPFSRLRFGYWFPSSESCSPHVRKCHDLGPGEWFDILRTSPAEPGLSSAVILDSGDVALGGWSDLAPVQVLESLRGDGMCDEILYMTRRGQTSPFAIAVARQLNLEESDRYDLYDLSNSQSAFSQALDTASGVWCTDWDRFDDKQVGAMYRDAYHDAILFSNNPQLQVAALSSGVRVDNRPLEGCRR